jgi:hypothetical protein
MPEQSLVNKPDRAGSPHPDFSSGEDYKRWRDSSSHEKQDADFQKKKSVVTVLDFKDPLAHTPVQASRN